jgi:hypothetical protein
MKFDGIARVQFFYNDRILKGWLQPCGPVLWATGAAARSSRRG